MRVHRTLPQKPQELMFWNGDGCILGYAGTCYFFCAAYSWAKLLAMLATIPGYTSADDEYIHKYWRVGRGGVVGAHLPSEEGVWVQPQRGAHIKRVYPLAKRVKRTPI